MKDSGYSEKLRGEVVRDATLGWERKVQVAEAGQRPVSRLRVGTERKTETEIDKEIIRVVQTTNTYGSILPGYVQFRI